MLTVFIIDEGLLPASEKGGNDYLTYILFNI